jgi:hypothetical protein
MGDDKQSMEQCEMRTQQTPSGTRFRAMTPSSALAMNLDQGCHPKQ